MTDSRGQRDDGAAASSWNYRAFGLTWRSTFRWPVPDTTAVSSVDVELRVAQDAEASWSGDAGAFDWLFRIDGGRFVVQRGAAGDFRLVHEHGARFHLDRNATVISCDPQVVSDPARKRLLLDTVLWTTTLLHGLEGLHASAVLGPRGVIAFLAGSGAGKTSLALELVARGYPLFSDDILIVERDDGGFVAHPSPPLVNLAAASSAPGVEIDVIARIGDEDWVSVPDAATEPAHLVQLLLLRRRPEAEDAVVPIAPTSLDLLPHAQAHAFVELGERRRFELCSNLALEVPVARLDADLDSSPARVADLVESLLDRSEVP